MKRTFAIAVLFLASPPLYAGLYYSAEAQADLPSKWRGFLLDQRVLRTIAFAPANGVPSLLREQYLRAANQLVESARQRSLSPDEAADLGALDIRLGEPMKAIEVLRAAQRRDPEHFRIAANLGTAWQLQGGFDEAIRALTDAVRLAPAPWKTVEEYHLKLVRLRSKQARNRVELDDLFGVNYLGESGKPEAGQIAAAQRQRLPKDDVALVQQLALWLPADGRLLWQLGELANAHGDVRTAASILDGCFIEFALASPDLRQRRAIYRQAADEIAKLPDEQHDRYRGDLSMKSPRPLLRKWDASMLPKIRADGVNLLPWQIVGETVVARPFKPAFSKYLDDLGGKRVAMTGFMYPLAADAAELSSFLLVENPIGCWFCETPDSASIVFVTLATGKTVLLKSGVIKIVGTLKLNRNDPEQYLHHIADAQLSEPD